MIDFDLHSEYPFYGVYNSSQDHYDPNKPRIKDIIWNHLDWLEEMYQQGRLRECVLDNCEKVLLCNTIYLGYDAFQCPNCGDGYISYHKCHSRFCTSCGVKTQKILAEKAAAMCIDVHHRHIVFTIPEPYRVLFRRDRSALNLLFVAARNTIDLVFNRNLFQRIKRKASKKLRKPNDTYYLFHNYDNTRQFAAIAAIHTFGRDLKWNPHIHMLVAEMYYDPKKNKCVNFNYFNFTQLRKTWQYELNRLLSDRFGDAFEPLKRKTYTQDAKGFYVYAKEQDNDKEAEEERNYSKDVQGCVNYMMRYAARPAMAESRITYYNKDTDEVTWFFDDHKTGQRINVHGTGLDLLMRMIIHIPDPEFRTVRYYGLYNPKEKEMLEKVYDLMKQKYIHSRTKEERKKSLHEKLNKLHFRTMCLDSFNRDILRCRCGAIMQYVTTYDPLEGKCNDREYREDCINEMRKLRLRGRGSPERSGYVTQPG